MKHKFSIEFVVDITLSFSDKTLTDSEKILAELYLRSAISLNLNDSIDCSKQYLTIHDEDLGQISCKFNLIKKSITYNSIK